PVARGTSGGITPLGTAGGAAGAAGMAGLAVLLAPRGAAPGAMHPDGILALAVAAAGVAGMLVDSLLGAAVQGQFECSACGARFERAGALCHEPVRHIKGYRWLDNDGVNVIATIVGGLAAALIA
ncbi:MAG: DUF92 domain-containing protein, partial [Gemmatimonadales bacterium]